MEISNELWYTRPAENWDQALPVGNGRLGAMVFGGIQHESLQLNEDSIWSGTLRNRNNPSALKNLPEIRQLIREKRISEAEELYKKAFVGTPTQQRHYQPLGDLSIDTDCGGYEDYRRSLSLDRAIAVTEWKSGGVSYRREVFSTAADNVICIEITSDKPNMISCAVGIDGRDDHYDVNRAYDNSTIIFSGNTDSADGIGFCAVISASAPDGAVEAVGNKLYAENCSSLTIVISARTSFYMPDYEKTALNDCRKALRKGFAKMLADHIADYKSLYGRASLILGDNSGRDKPIPTNERLEALRSGKPDNRLAELYWNFSRYLMISGSRPHTLPLNLQGIWNKDMWPAWGSKYTININTEMNYWAAEEQNLSECHLPLFDLIERMRENGRETAGKMYGCGGFMAHHNTDIWGDTAPQDLWLPATLWQTGAAWLCLHIFEHYRFTGDKEFLSDKYDTLKEAAEFFVDFLTENSRGQLVTCPSVSPENTYIADNGEKGSVCEGPTMDTQIVRELFSAVIKSSEILGRDKAFAEKLKAISARLPQNQIGKYGQIMEWAEDYDEAEPGHRHISQLFGLYPADQITCRRTPDLAKAARATIERRLSYGGGHTGWSRAWIINMWARLLDGERVQENIRLLLANSTNSNMLDSHPPFQIDGNFGGGAGITEAILQSHSEEINLLPALPPSWESGEARGLVARGGFEVSVSWRKGCLERAEILSKCGNVCRLFSTVPLRISAERVELIDNVYTFETEKGAVYPIERAK